jgi:hypothetical protein
MNKHVTLGCRNRTTELNFSLFRKSTAKNTAKTKSAAHLDRVHRKSDPAQTKRLKTLACDLE